MAVLRKGREEKIDERICRVESNADRAVDECRIFREQFKVLQDDRKKDVEETAEFIKQIISAGKSEWQQSVGRLGGELDHLKNEIHASLTGELARIVNLLDTKVDLREVQQALNDCQGDIRDQLREFRDAVTSEQRQAEADLRKLVDRKANVQDVHD